MLTIYLIALAIGGTLIVISLAFGGHGDADAELDTDTSLEAEADVDHGLDVGGVDLWLPFASLRFWIFFSAFFGLAGTLLRTLGGMQAELVVGGISLGVGYASGVGAVAALRWLVSREADSSIQGADMVGARGQVLLPVTREKTGKIRLALKGQIVDVRAKTDDPGEFAIGASVMVYDTHADGHVVVTKADN